MKKVYIASPYAGDVERNVEMARDYCRFAVKQDVIPYAPHLLFTQFLNDTKPREREMGCRMGTELLASCDELWAFGESISNGMAAEIAEARRLGIHAEFITSQEVQRAREMMNKPVKSTIFIYTGDRNERIERLSDSSMAPYEDAAVPDSVLKWRENFRDSSLKLYISKLYGKYGIYAVNEFDLLTCKNLFSGDEAAMRVYVKDVAAVLADSEVMGGIQVYSGIGTGNGGCDEICAFIPADTEPDRARAILAEVDAKANPCRVMEPEREHNISIEMGMT